MPKLTYRPKSHEDPETTSTHGYHFEKGKAVEVSDQAYAKLKNNPWFQGGKAAEEQAASMSAASVGDGTPVSSALEPQYPPGSGSKYAPDYAKVSEGIVAPDSAEATNAGNDVAKRGPGRPKHS